MKKLSVILLLSAISGACISQSDLSKDLYLTKNFADGSFKKINASGSHGNIEVSTAPGKEAKVEVFAEGRVNGRTLNKEEVKSMMEEYYSLELSVSGDVLTVAARKKKDFFNGNRMLSVSFRIYAGSDKSTDLETSHGNLRISGMTGSQELSTDHGDIDVDDIAGRVVAKTSHGNISIAGAKKDIDAETDHGDLEIRESNGKIKLLTTNGNINLTKLSGNIRADTDHGDVTGKQIGGDLVTSTSHGNIRLDGFSSSVEASTDHGNLDVYSTKITGNIFLKNSSGDISLQLPKGIAMDLDLQGRKVAVNSMTNFSGSQQNEFVRGTLNGGGTKIIAKTDKGQVQLTFD